MTARFHSLTLLFAILCGISSACAPIEYSVVIVEASEAIESARVAGAECTQSQLDARSPVTASKAKPESGTELASTETSATSADESAPLCTAPYEFYKAVEYQSKAREEVGYSDYEAALKYARVARDSARMARKISESGAASEEAGK